MSSRAFWLGGGILAAFAVGILTGAVSIRPAEVWEGLVNPASPSASIVRELRLPRVLLAFAVGGSLGVCGGALQAMIRNPLADPYLLGLSGGSGLGAVIAISLGGGGRLSVPLAAFAGAMLAGYAGKAYQAMGDPYLLPAIAAVVLGGTPVIGGRATALGTALGMLVIGVVNNGVRNYGKDDLWGQLVLGLALLAAVEVDRIRNRKKA